MELTREHFRLLIFDSFRSGLSRQECIDELDWRSLISDKAPSHNTAKNLFNALNSGRRSLKYEVREGPPHISSNYRLIDWPNVESAAVQP